VCLEVFGYRLYALPNAVSDDQQQEAPAPKVCGQRIIELDFIEPRVNHPHQV
jgi:hypothetical protein